MKKIGISLLALGILWGIVALSMETSVATKGKHGVPKRVVNLSLMEQRRTHLTIATLATLVGAIFTGIGFIQPGQFSGANHHRNSTARRCPFCAEEIQQAAVVCKHCQRDIPPDWKDPGSDQSASTASSTAEILGGTIRKTRRGFIKRVQALYLGNFGLSRTFWGSGVALLVLFPVIIVIGQSHEVVIAALMILYLSFGTMCVFGIHRAATAYEGPKVWSISARIVNAVIILFLVLCSILVFG